MDTHTKLHYAGIALALGLSSTALVHTPTPVHDVAVHEIQRPSRFDWASLGQDKTIALGDALKSLGPHKLTIFCSEPHCHDLQLDLDDATQLAGWESQFEVRYVDSEGDKGISVGPPGPDAENLAAALAKATGLHAEIVPIDGLDGLGIIIGKVAR
jgi:hypothetical protein